MSDLSALERYFCAELAPVVCATEQDYYRLWQERELCTLTPVNQAIVGGLLADRLPWVFTAGYQATLKNAFRDLPERGWAAFAATEDQHDPEAHPGTTLHTTGDGFILSGHKSWVAHSKVVDHLIITVNDPAGDKRRARGLVLENGRRGVRLSHRERPNFLAALSQGFAEFIDTPVGTHEVFEFEPIRQFGRTEAKFVMLSSVAFMLGHLQESHTLIDRLVTLAGCLLSLIAERETSRQVYASVDREFQACVNGFEDSIDVTLIPDYASDQKLFRMYSAKIQRRAAYAKAEASNEHVG